MVIWNSILIEVLQEGAINKINFWQALGLLALAKIFFGGLPSSWWTKRKKINASEKDPAIKKLQSMTSEEKDQFRAQWRKQFESPRENDQSCKK
jgi:hypothetical protein